MTNNIIGYKETFRLLNISLKDNEPMFLEAGLSSAVYAVINNPFSGNVAYSKAIALLPKVKIYPVRFSRVFWQEQQEDSDDTTVYGQSHFVATSGEKGSHIAVELNEDEFLEYRIMTKPQLEKRVFVDNVVDADIRNIASEVTKIVIKDDLESCVAFDTLIKNDYEWDIFNGTAYYLIQGHAPSPAKQYCSIKECLYLNYVDFDPVIKQQRAILGDLRPVCIQEDINGRYYKVDGGIPNRIEIPMKSTDRIALNWLVNGIVDIETTDISLADFDSL